MKTFIYKGRFIRRFLKMENKNIAFMIMPVLNSDNQLYSQTKVEHFLNIFQGIENIVFSCDICDM